MDYKKACFMLDIDSSDPQINIQMVRKKYKLLALQYHPDKNKHQDSKDKFIEIKEAYDFLELYLQTDCDCEYEESKSNDTTSEYSEYTELLYYFLNAYASPVLSHIISKLLLNTESFTYKTIELLDKEDMWEMYHFLKKYNKILNISDEILMKMRTWIHDKYKDDIIVYLNPSLQDLLEYNCYKLWEKDEYYVVPLWHSEVHFDMKGTSHKIMVFCEPEIKHPHVSINEENEIIIEHKVALNKALLDNPYITFTIGKKIISIPVEQVHLKSVQYIRIPEQGIPKIDKHSIYSVQNKHDIIVKLLLF